MILYWGWALNVYLHLPLTLHLVILAIRKFLLNTDEGSKFRKDLVLHRFTDYLSLLVDHLHVVHQVLNIAVVLMRILEEPDSLEMTHLVDKRFSLH